MPTRTKTEITIQTRQTTVVRGLRVRCQQCGAEVSITAGDDLNVSQATPGEIVAAHPHPALESNLQSNTASDFAGKSETPGGAEAPQL